MSASSHAKIWLFCPTCGMVCWAWVWDDERVKANASIDQLRGHDITTVYPGHGKPFAMEPFLSSRHKENAKGE